MSGYRRFVAYVYEYQKGKKGSNCGFIKVEVREQRCTMEVHLHCVGLTPQVECNVYGFVRKDGLMDGILLGSCETGEDTAECLIETDSLNMGGSGISLGRMGGMVLVTESGGFFGTEWDDQPIRPDNFRELQKPEPQRQREASIENKKQPQPEDRKESRQDIIVREDSSENEAENGEIPDSSGEGDDDNLIETALAESNKEVSNKDGMVSAEENSEQMDTVASINAEGAGDEGVKEKMPCVTDAIGESPGEQKETGGDSYVSKDGAIEVFQEEVSDQEPDTGAQDRMVKPDEKEAAGESRKAEDLKSGSRESENPKAENMKSGSRKRENPEAEGVSESGKTYDAEINDAKTYNAGTYRAKASDEVFKRDKAEAGENNEQAVASGFGQPDTAREKQKAYDSEVNSEVISQSMTATAEEFPIGGNARLGAESEAALETRPNLVTICPPNPHCSPGPSQPMPPEPPILGPGPVLPPDSAPGPSQLMPPEPPILGPGPVLPPDSAPGPSRPMPPKPPMPGPGPVLPPNRAPSQRQPMPPRPPILGPGPALPPNRAPGPSQQMQSNSGFGQYAPRRQGRMANVPVGEEFMPFSDGELTRCWKIHPKDFAYFQHRECALRNNRFLLHGYYNFGHLLLGQKANGQYILGVPGGYDQQERFMANMFGFPYFKQSSQIELPKGRGGYWYRLINAPYFH